MKGELMQMKTIRGFGEVIQKDNPTAESSHRSAETPMKESSGKADRKIRGKDIVITLQPAAILIGGFATFRYVAPSTFYQTADSLRQVIQDPPTFSEVYYKAVDALFSPYGAACSAFLASAGFYKGCKHKALAFLAESAYKRGQNLYNQGDSALENDPHDKDGLELRLKGARLMLKAHARGSQKATRQIVRIESALSRSMQDQDPDLSHMIMAEDRFDDLKNKDQQLQPLAKIIGSYTT